MKLFLLINTLILLIFDKSIADHYFDSLALFIKDGMDHDISPCDDLYSHVCGSSERKILHLEEWKVENLFGLDIYEEIFEMYEDTKDDFEKYNQNSKFSKDIAWINVCMKENTSEKVEVFNGYLEMFGAWPMVSEKNDKSWIKIETNFAKVRGLSTFFHLSLSREGNFVIKFPERFSFNVIKCIETDEDMKDMILPVFKPLIAQMKQNIDISDIETKLFDAIQGLRKFQNKWKKIHDKYNTDRCTIINLLTLQTRVTTYLSENNQKDINLLGIFEAMFEKTTLSRSVFLVKMCVSIEYWKEFSLLLSKTPKPVLENYIYTTLVLNDDEILNHDTDDYENRLYNCIKESPVIGGFLSEIANTPEMVSRKDYILKMLVEIRKQFKIEINRSWISADLRKVLIEKLEKMQIHFSNFDNDNQPDSIYFSKVSYEFEIEESYMESLFNFRKAQFQFLVKKYQEMNKLRSSNIESSAGYKKLINTIYIPTEMMISFLVDVDNPISVNYGVMGFILAHEIGHGLFLDDYMDNVNKSIETFNKYNEYKYCLDFQMKTYGVDFRKTFSENYADAVGIKVAFNTLKRIICQSANADKEITELDCKHWRKIFFTFLPTYLCERPIVKEYNMGLYPPSTTRVNNLVSNVKAFNEEFSCKESNNLYRTKKCHIWSET